MKRYILGILFFFMVLNGVFSQNSTAAEKRPVLFLYEESNDKLDPWIERIRDQLTDRGIPFESFPAEETGSADLSEYDEIFLYCAVMAFGSQEPLRDWLKTGPELEGKDVTLLITANRWFLDKYTRQLMTLLRRSDAVNVDAVTSVTKDLSEAEKDSLAGEAAGFLR